LVNLGLSSVNVNDKWNRISSKAVFPNVIFHLS